MSRTLLRALSAPLVTGALVLAGTPLLTSPANAVPTVPGLGCAVNAVQSLASSGGAVAIPDLVGNVSKVINVADTGALSWLRLRTNITHPNPSDLLVTLTSPAGSILTLTSQNGGGNDNVFDGTWWQDDAGATAPPGSAAEATYANGVTEPLLAPEEALAGLRGQGVAGNWTLTVADTALGGTGSLVGWTLEYATRSGGAPDLANLGTGTLPGGVIPAGATQAFTYDLDDAALGAVQDVVARFDIDGATSAVKATLVPPTGDVVTLTNANPSMFGSFLGGIDLSDHAGVVPGLGPIADQLLQMLLGGLRMATPQEPLSALTGVVPSGLWTLEITNLGLVPLTLNGWGLDLTTSSCGLDGAVTALSTLPSQVPVGSVFSYPVQVVNKRLAPLTAGNLGLTLPAGLELVSVTSTLGSCTDVNCLLGTLLPGDSAIVVYLLKAVTDGAKTLTVNLTHGGLDILPLDNLLSTIMNVTPAPATPPVILPGTPPGGGAAPKDITAPGLVMLLGKDKLKTVAKKGLQVVLGGTEAGKLTLKVKLPGKVAKRLKLPRLIGSRTVVLSKATTAKLRVKVSKKAAKKLAKATKALRLVVKGKLRDAAGNTGKATAGGKYKN